MEVLILEEAEEEDSEAADDDEDSDITPAAENGTSEDKAEDESGIGADFEAETELRETSQSVSYKEPQVKQLRLQSHPPLIRLSSLYRPVSRSAFFGFARPACRSTLPMGLCADPYNPSIAIS